jgi:hypothetical protein
MYMSCQYSYEPVDSDSIATDSLVIREIDVQMGVDENGNPVVRHTQPEPIDVLPNDVGTDNGNNGEATEPKKKKAQPEYEEVYF